MMKSEKLLLIAIALISTLAGCGSADKVPEPSPAPGGELQKDVVFLNYVFAGAEDDVVVGVRSYYGEYEGNETTLYAFAVRTVEMFDYEQDPPEDYPVQEEGESVEAYDRRRWNFGAEKAVELMEDTGLCVLYEYPLCDYAKREMNLEAYYSVENQSYGACVVIGTEEEIAEVFGKYGLETEEYYLTAKSVPRPDAMELLKEKGWDFRQDFSDMAPEAYEPYFGSGLYVVQRVTLQ